MCVTSFFAFSGANFLFICVISFLFTFYWPHSQKWFPHFDIDFCLLWFKYKVKWVCATLNEGYMRAANKGSKNLYRFFNQNLKYQPSIERRIFLVRLFYSFFWDCRSTKLSRLFSGNLPAMFSLFLSQKSILYRTMIVSVLFYCSPACRVIIGAFTESKKIQRKVLRWATRTENCNETLSKMNFCPICDQIAQAVRILALKIWLALEENNIKLYVNQMTNNSR